MKKIWLGAAKVELEAKRLDLRNGPGDLRNALTNLVTVAAISATLVTISSTAIGSVVAKRQKNLEGHKAELRAKLESDEAIGASGSNNFPVRV